MRVVSLQGRWSPEVRYYDEQEDRLHDYDDYVMLGYEEQRRCVEMHWSEEEQLWVEG